MLCVIQGGFWKNLVIFLRDWVDSAPEVDSRPALLPQVARTSSTTAVACSILVLLVFTHLALCSRRLLTHGMEKCAQSMLRLPSSFSSETWTIFL